MANIKKSISKNIKKVNTKKKEEYPEKNQLLTLAKIIFGVIVIAATVTGLYYIISGDYSLNDSKTEIVYDEIMAGQIFEKQDETYYVALYKYDSEKDLSEKIDAKTSTIYKVDLNKKINSQIIGEKSNLKTDNIEELKVTQATLIKVEKNKNVETVEGYEEIVKYLEAIN